ncbi:MAG: hypothetical protein Q4C76_06835 [Bacillota bacterium]|nr:hypothetical protein [Bacillota bacterium]
MNLSKQLTRRECILLTILAVILLCAVYIFAVHRPVTEDMDRIRQESESVAADLTVLETKQLHMDQMQAELDAIRQSSNVTQIPPYDNLEQIMGFLNNLLTSASDYKLNFDTPSQDENSQLIRRPMSLTYTCDSYQRAKGMVLQLESCPYRCQITDLSMSPVNENNTSDEHVPLTLGAVTVSLRVTFYESRI